MMGVFAAKLYLSTRPLDDRQKHHVRALGRGCAAILVLLLAIDASGTFQRHAPFLDYLRQSHLYSPFISVMLYAIACCPDTLGRWLSRPRASWQASSYAIYLCQYYGPPVFDMVSVASVPAMEWATAWLRVLLTLAVLLGLAEMMHRWVDVPSRRCLRRAVGQLAAGRHVVAVPAAVP